MSGNSQQVNLLENARFQLYSNVRLVAQGNRQRAQNRGKVRRQRGIGRFNQQNRPNAPEPVKISTVKQCKTTKAAAIVDLTDKKDEGEVSEPLSM
jgi:hypothetical protein